MRYECDEDEIIPTSKASAYQPCRSQHFDSPFTVSFPLLLFCCLVALLSPFSVLHLTVPTNLLNVDTKRWARLASASSWGVFRPLSFPKTGAFLGKQCQIPSFRSAYITKWYRFHKDFLSLAFVHTSPVWMVCPTGCGTSAKRRGNTRSCVYTQRCIRSKMTQWFFLCFFVLLFLFFVDLRWWWAARMWKPSLYALACAASKPKFNSIPPRKLFGLSFHFQWAFRFQYRCPDLENVCARVFETLVLFLS